MSHQEKAAIIEANRIRMNKGWATQENSISIFLRRPPPAPPSSSSSSSSSSSYYYYYYYYYDCYYH